MTFDGSKNVFVSRQRVLCHHINRKPLFHPLPVLPFVVERADVFAVDMKRVFRGVIHLHIAHVAAAHKTFRVAVQFDVPYDLEAPMTAFRVRDAARLASVASVAGRLRLTSRRAVLVFGS